MEAELQSAQKIEALSNRDVTRQPDSGTASSRVFNFVFAPDPDYSDVL